MKANKCFLHVGYCAMYFHIHYFMTALKNRYHYCHFVGEEAVDFNLRPQSVYSPMRK